MDVLEGVRGDLYIGLWCQETVDAAGTKHQYEAYNFV